MPDPLQSWRPPPLPSWAAVSLFALAGVLVSGGAFLLGGPGALLPAAGGMTFGAFTAAAVATRPALPWIAIGWIGAALATVLTDPMLFLGALIALAALASLEFARFGTRCLVAALFAALAVHVGAAQAQGATVLAAFTLGLAAGLVTTQIAGLGQILPKSPATRAQGWVMFLFLSLGLIATALLIAVLDEPRSYWIAFIFALRGFTPLERQHSAVLRYGLFAGTGILGALALAALLPAVAAQLLTALAAALFGLRYVAHPKPIAAGLFTLAIVLASSATTVDAVYRAEAVAIVILLVLALSLILNGLWRLTTVLIRA